MKGIQSAAPSIIWANMKIWCSKMQPLFGNQGSDLGTYLMEMSLVLRPPREMHFCRSRCRIHCVREEKWRWTSKNGANIWCLGHFDFKMCFAPQPCALFEQFNFQKFSGPGVPSTFCFVPWPHALFEQFNFQKCSEHDFFTFWLEHVLRATPACTFWTTQLPKVFRTQCFFGILASKCASRHSRSSTPKSESDIWFQNYREFRNPFPEWNATWRFPKAPTYRSTCNDLTTTSICVQKMPFHFPNTCPEGGAP